MEIGKLMSFFSVESQAGWILIVAFLASIFSLISVCFWTRAKLLLYIFA